MPKIRGWIFDTPDDRSAAISCDALGAAVRDSRHASEQNRFAPGGWCDCADRGFSRRVRGYAWCRTGLRRSRDSYCLRCGHRARVARAPVAVAAVATAHEMPDRPGAIKRAPEPSRGMGANLEIIIERQFGSVSLLRKRRLFQPEPMLDSPLIRKRTCQPSEVCRISPR